MIFLFLKSWKGLLLYSFLSSVYYFFNCILFCIQAVTIEISNLSIVCVYYRLNDIQPVIYVIYQQFQAHCIWNWPKLSKLLLLLTFYIKTNFASYINNNYWFFYFWKVEKVYFHIIFCSLYIIFLVVFYLYTRLY